MPRYEDIKNKNQSIGSKYGLKRDIGLADSHSGNDSHENDFYKSLTHVSNSLEESWNWFRQQKSKLKRQGVMFDDPFFKSDRSTLSKEALNRSMDIQWKRPKEFCNNPHFVVEGASRFDVRQGELGDCWLLAAVSSLSLYQNLFDRVVPSEQDFNDSDYCGVFLFRFWQFGTWVDVVIDDKLPVRNNKLIYMHSTEGNEFWSALLEKAYAKLSFTYESLKGGTSSEAMVDFTGGITELFDLGKNAPENLWNIMLHGNKKFSLMGCSIDALPTEIESKGEKGLIKGHAYSITDVKFVHTRHGEVKLIRIRNPWGNECEWNGAWSDKSREWNDISPSELKSLGLVFSDDGEFWMCYSDFIQYFTKLEICHLGPHSAECGAGLKQTSGQQSGEHHHVNKSVNRWKMCLEHADWQRNVTAGGCRNFLNTFHMNPQFRVTVVDADENDDKDEGTLIVGLMQKERRSKRQEGQEMLTIGYVIYLLKDNYYENSVLDTKFFRVNASCAKSPSFINIREICGRHKLKPGNYVIIPSTFNPNEEAKFLLRIFSENASDSKQLDEKTEIVELDWKNNMTAEQQREEEENNARLKMAFEKIAGEDGELDAFELQQVINSAFKKELVQSDGFSIETCRSLVAMMDIDQSGKLGFDEFNILWTDLRLWKTTFKKFDADQNGNFNTSELRQALLHIGFRVSNRIFTAVCTRYSNKDGNIGFDDYIILVARLKTVFLTYKAQKKTSNNEAIFPQDRFMQCVLYM